MHVVDSSRTGIGLLAIALTLGGGNAAQGTVLSASGDIFIGVRPPNPAPTCTEISSPGFFDLSCSQPDFGDARVVASATLDPSNVPELAALAQLTTPASAIGATADVVAFFQDRLVFASRAETAEWVFEVNGSIVETGSPGDGGAAEFDFGTTGLSDLFRAYSVGVTDEVISVSTLIPLGREVPIHARLRALGGAPAGGTVIVDFSATVSLIDVIVRDADGNRIFDPIWSESGALYGQAPSSVPEPSCTLGILLALVGLGRRRRRWTGR